MRRGQLLLVQPSCQLLLLFSMSNVRLRISFKSSWLWVGGGGCVVVVVLESHFKPKTSRTILTTFSLCGGGWVGGGVKSFSCQTQLRLC